MHIHRAIRYHWIWGAQTPVAILRRHAAGRQKFFFLVSWFGWVGAAFLDARFLMFLLGLTFFVCSKWAACSKWLLDIPDSVHCALFGSRRRCRAAQGARAKRFAIAHGPAYSTVSFQYHVFREFSTCFGTFHSFHLMQGCNDTRDGSAVCRYACKTVRVILTAPRMELLERYHPKNVTFANGAGWTQFGLREYIRDAMLKPEDWTRVCARLSCTSAFGRWRGKIFV